MSYPVFPERDMTGTWRNTGGTNRDTVGTEWEYRTFVLYTER